MYPAILNTHYMSSKGAVLFPNHTRIVGGKLYVRHGDTFYQTKARHNGAYPINYEVAKDHPEHKAVFDAFAVPLYPQEELKKAA